MKKNLPTAEALLVAIRAKCMDCSGNQRKEVERCKLKDCSLYPYRSVEMLTDEELAQRVLDEVGVEIDWGQPIDLAQPKEPLRKSKDTKEE